ncbi:hypothetical protein BU24DRAFT_223776 [Aaosphaeria arxii CBS 175.79]|uniref:Uncharacterized protein n=1 Tax=Aaosphaeria arxii CBS 175.79 TaxID=1450172 RepID=A0A6A5XP41_9PLEO|nr:uncharacterized protein BU24DRAFT_223776 [Aaosphaeria arxii CBS 175.79]KAF2014912.1 hypothetical protein BU24DRAFT_223776 [Aaosphaeria arxii CBS 175.79]
MAARSRPRGGHMKEELDEERSIWSQIRDDAKRIDSLLTRDVEIVASNTTIGKRHGCIVGKSDGTADKILYLSVPGDGRPSTLLFLRPTRLSQSGDALTLLYIYMLL